ncbi:FtsK/SpoIIIE domain-containing protein [Pseudonocardia nigra]|uniref:FtsK/SpoIIIE domain-containing protein n=1 Tax=Pseudonocardia nigra TaxID=1921578 RepID=UPI0027E33779|nr:FtsK/SpoIIIE domain-containing protein [Pseudonocardia nigra]
MRDLLRRPRPARVVLPVSIWDPVHLGIYENAAPVRPYLIYKNLLTAGEPGSGKSGALNNICAHAALAGDCRLWLMDGKEVELGLWRACAERFVGPDPAEALDTLAELQAEMQRRYATLRAARRRHIVRDDTVHAVVLVIDELAYYSATAGDKKQREQFALLLRDLVARGRAAGVIVVAATQRPSHDIIPTSLRDLFGYRLAFRCTTETSSDIVLGHGWHARGYDASQLDPAAPGVGWLLAEDGTPARMRCSWLTDDDIDLIARKAATP